MPDNETMETPEMTPREALDAIGDISIGVAVGGKNIRDLKEYAIISDAYDVLDASNELQSEEKATEVMNMVEEWFKLHYAALPSELGSTRESWFKIRDNVKDIIAGRKPTYEIK